MKALELQKERKLLFSTQDIASALSIGKASANVTASRYVKNGTLIRLKKDFYITAEKYNNLKEEELFKIANVLQTPSYVSLVSALSFYNITTQQQRNFVESVSYRRTKNFSVKEIQFTFSRLKKSMYEGFELKEGFFIAIADKAMADIVYLSSLGRYTCDFAAVDFKKINKKKVRQFLEKSNDRAISFWETLCSSYKI